jgi:hypothetical protein
MIVTAEEAFMAVLFAIRMYFSISAAGNRHFHLTPLAYPPPRVGEFFRRNVFFRPQRTMVTLHGAEPFLWNPNPEYSMTASIYSVN